MTDDELANYFRAGFTELEARIDARPASNTRRRARRLVSIAHRAMDELKDLAVDDGAISTLSGGDPKPDNGD